MRCSDPQRAHVLRSGSASVKGIDVGLSHFRFTRLWLCLTDEELLFFKDPAAALSKADASIRYDDIKSCSPDTQRANCLKVACSASKTVHMCFKTSQELKLWSSEIEACLKPVLEIGQFPPTENLSFGKRTSDIFSSFDSARSPQYGKSLRDSALSGATLYTVTTGTRRFSAWSTSTAYDLDEETWPELSDFKMDDDIQLEIIDEMDENQPERPSSPVDPDLIFDLDRVHLAVSDYPVSREKELDIPDLTGQVSKVGDHAVAVGGFSDIWMGTSDANGRNEMVAIKVIRSFCFDPKTEPKLQKRLKQELDIWKRLRHINIVPLYGVVHDMGRFASMISPWMKNGNASKFFEGQDIEETLARRLKLLYEVASGLEYLHCFAPPVVHGDLKGSNVMVSDTGHAMLTDFGISTIIEETTEHTASTFAGSVRWMAFELFSGYCDIKGSEEGGGSVHLSTHSDIWSFGCTVLEIISGKVPYYYRKNEPQVLHEVIRGLKPLREELRAAYPGIPPDMWTFLLSCWRDNPKNRPSVIRVKETIGDFYRERRRMGIVFEDIAV